MSAQAKPNVLVFGALNSIAGVLIQHLIPPAPAEPLISHIRLVDKYSINPPTTYVSKTIRRLLEVHKDLVEYRQGNITNAEIVNACYSNPSPNGRLYTHIIDLSGNTEYEHPIAAHLIHTLAPAVLIARASAAQLARYPGSIKAHIRVIPPFYEHLNPKKRYTEEDEKGWQFDVGKGALRALVWHETVRAVASVVGLPLVMIKFALPYGEGVLGFEVTSIILLGLVYQQQKKDMKLLWSPKLPKNTINVKDTVGIIWATAEWMSTKTREEANALAGVTIQPSNDPLLATTPPLSPYLVPAEAGAVVVPVFNATDESDSTQKSIAAVITEVFGVKVGFYSGLAGLLVGWKMRDLTENVNEMHMEEWTKIIGGSDPPVPNTPLSPYMPLYQLEEHGCALDGEKTKKMIQYKHRYPQFNKESVQEYIDWCVQEGIWPQTKKV